VTLVVGLGVGFWIGPDQEFFLFGTVIVLGLIFVYGAGNLGVWLHYRREGRAEFNWLLHLVLPLVSTVALVWVGWKSIHPLPASPIKYAPWIVGLWLVGGLLVLAGMKIGEGWVPRAGDIAPEQPPAEESPDLSARV
jgi:amino acid transporter